MQDSVTFTFHGPYGRQQESFNKTKTRIDLSAHVIERIDLSPISECLQLETLDLSGNQLKSLDLHPIESCKNLRTVNLSSNHLSRIDLWPLQKCRRLWDIDLSHNWLVSVNITPVVDRAVTILNQEIPISIDYIYKYVYEPLEFYKNIYLSGRPDKHTSRFLNIRWLGYKNQYRYDKWSLFKSRLEPIISRIDSDFWFHLQKGLLEGMDMRALAGFDGNPHEILNTVNDNLSFSDAYSAVYEGVVNLLEKQIVGGGPTIFLDIEDFKKTSASRLISLIVAERQKEIEHTRIPLYGNKASLRPLWFTAYGVEILQALEQGLETDLKELAQVKASFSKVGIRIKTEEVDFLVEDVRPPISKSIETFILELVRSMRKEPDLVRRKYWTDE